MRSWLSIAELPDQERLIIVRRYKDGETFSKIARDRGLSESRIHQLHRRALEQLRASLESGEIRWREGSVTLSPAGV